jgi:hypothetical protein
LDLVFSPIDFVDFCTAATFSALAAIEFAVRREVDSCRAVPGGSSSSSEKTAFDLRCLFAGGEAIHNGAETEREILEVSHWETPTRRESRKSQL